MIDRETPQDNASGHAPIRRGGRKRDRDGATAGPRADHIHLRNPFLPQPVFSQDRVEAIHDTALRVLEELGMRVLLKEGRDLFRQGGAIVDEDTMMVRIGRDIVAAALTSAPKSVRLRAANPQRENLFEPGAMLFYPGAGCPNAFDRERGRRPGTLRDYRETLKLQQSFDVMHWLGPSAEPQDVPVHMRHYAMMEGQITLADKPLFVYARGRGQTLGSFEAIRVEHGLDEAEFENGVWATTVINTNSPRQIDVPMTRGIIDFARAGQLAFITPFCLAGAMAPVTMAGALTLQHAEALAGITLSQLARPGAPVAYGGFSSNVDMKSGSPAFGTPEHVQANLGSGQLARLIGLPWRSATGSASKLADAQGAQETLMGLWSAILAGATVTVHAAGWLEGGLVFGYEKFVSDMEALQSFAALCAPVAQDDAAIGFDAIAEVQPGGHFFATQHTMERYRNAFQPPLLADLQNHGAWAEAGSQDAETRATAIWKARLAEYSPPPAAREAAGRLEPWLARMRQGKGAPPEE
jgi:trimethylamine--corrinoid protein Co-methyltransferase